jgi:3-isopropylmalate/(R)-2-methylmalate dehydratase small subunit
MEDIDPEFVSRVRPGDIVVAGEDFGCGSSREHAVWALRSAGIAAVIASSYARIFFRNSYNNGFPAIECPGFADKVSDQDDLEVDLEKGMVRNHTRGTEHAFIPLTPFVQQLLDAGGLLPMIARQRGGEYKATVPHPKPDVGISNLTQPS